MRTFPTVMCVLAVVATGFGALAQTRGERAYQVAKDQNACSDRPILDAKFTDETETTVEVRCADGALGGNGAVVAGAAVIVLLALAAGGGGSGGGGGSRGNTVGVSSGSAVSGTQ